MAWLDTNSLLFSHALEYQNKIIELITSSGEAIQALHDYIWKVVTQVMEDAGKSMADGLGITLHLVDMLPTILLQLAFNTATAGLIGCTPEVYAAQPKTRTDGLDFSHACPHQAATKMRWLYSMKKSSKMHAWYRRKGNPAHMAIDCGQCGFHVGVKAVENEGE